MKTSTYTWDEHVALGKLLRKFRDKDFDFCKLANTYGTSSKVARRALRLIRAIDDLRCELDNRVAAENPKRPDAAIRVYYGDLEQFERDRPGE